MIRCSQQNNIVARKNRHLLVLEVFRALMISSNNPCYLWEEVVLDATYLINRMSSRTLGFKSPL